MTFGYNTEVQALKPPPVLTRETCYSGPQYTTVRFSNVIQWVAPLGSEGLFVMQNPSKIWGGLIVKIDWQPIHFLQPLLTQSAFSCDLNNAEEKQQHGRSGFLAGSCLLHLEFKRWHAHTFPYTKYSNHNLSDANWQISLDLGGSALTDSNWAGVWTRLRFP